MSVLVYAENHGGNFKKTAFETVNFGKKIANQKGTECIALVVGDGGNAGQLGKYGADKVLHVGAGSFDSQVYAAIIAQVAQQNASDVVVMTHSSSGKSILGRVAVKLDAGSVSAVNSMPTMDGGFKVKKSVFSGKALAEYQINTDHKVLSLAGNSFQIEEMGSEASVEQVAADVPAAKVEVLETKVAEGTVPLPEAELVVSAGRGMKGPENWGIIEDLAAELGATTACSRPVADSDWRPHHEHVGQTGVAIKPNLYIAAGISGAIQHLAGVNNSKTIVVINNDSEAPFFKAADYGVVGDLFDVVPRLTEAVKKFKNQ